MATHFAQIDLSNLVIGPTETGQNGNKYKQISYKGQQFKNIQLGASIFDLIRCPFGAEQVSQKQPDKFCVKIDANTQLSTFIQTMDDMVIKSVTEEPNGDRSSYLHRSALKITGEYGTLKIKIQPDTKILVTEFVNDKKIQTPVCGSKEDIVAGCMILPIIKIQGGVYFLDQSDDGQTYYGTSIVATDILVVKKAAAPPVGFDLGDVTVED